MLTAADNDLLCRVEGDAPMGRLMRRHWIPACMSEEVAERDGAPVRVRLLGEDLVAFRDTRRPARRDRRALPASPRVAGARPQRGMRAALPVPRLEDRRRRQHRRQARRSRVRAGSAPTVKHQDLSLPRSRRLRLGMDGRSATRCAEFAAAGVGALARHPHQHRQDARRLQLGAGARRRDRLGAQLEPAFDRHGAGERRRRRRDVERMAAPVDRQGAAAAGAAHATSASATSRSAVRSRTRRTHDYLRITLFVAPFTVLIPPNDRYNLSILNIPQDDTHTMFYFIAWSDRRRHRPGRVAQVLRRAGRRRPRRAVPPHSHAATTTTCRTAAR